ncbi:MAG: type II toxin-antitoxin system Phd/YefM family antitoxin [Acidimicrobiia bacterium]|nr:type II toxin-antitoxin system Phd/YefM family antitoxin [Acidimicrobiia bacterium]
MSTSRDVDDQRAGSASRHISVRVPIALHERLEALAADGNETVSQCARRLLTEGLAAPDRSAIDDAISALLLLRHQLAQPDRRSEVGQPTASRTVNVLNAKTDLQHLLDDVGRGIEIIITHAGAKRARLVPIVDPHRSTEQIRNR